MLNCTLPRCISTFNTRTCTTCPTATTLSGSFTKRSAISETCTRPSCLTPISTKAPKSTTLRTVPCKIMPVCKSSIFNTSWRKMGAGSASRGSSPGFSRFSRMSFNVGRPTPIFLARSAQTSCSLFPPPSPRLLRPRLFCSFTSWRNCVMRSAGLPDCPLSLFGSISSKARAAA